MTQTAKDEGCPEAPLECMEFTRLEAYIEARIQEEWLWGLAVGLQYDEHSTKVMWMKTKFGRRVCFFLQP